MVDSGELVGQPGQLSRSARSRDAVDDPADGARRCSPRASTAWRPPTSTCCSRIAAIGEIATRRPARARRRVPADELRKSLRRLEMAGLLVERADGERLAYEFKHSLTQAVAYDTLLHQRRQRAASRASCTRSPTATTFDVLARHAVLGEAWEEALAYLRDAGRARRRAFRGRRGDRLFRARARRARAPAAVAAARSRRRSTCTATCATRWCRSDRISGCSTCCKRRSASPRSWATSSAWRRCSRSSATTTATSGTRTSRSRRASRRSILGERVGARRPADHRQHERRRDLSHARQLPEGARIPEPRDRADRSRPRARSPGPGRDCRRCARAATSPGRSPSWATSSGARTLRPRRPAHRGRVAITRTALPRLPRARRHARAAGRIRVGDPDPRRAASPRASRCRCCVRRSPPIWAWRYARCGRIAEGLAHLDAAVEGATTDGPDEPPAADARQVRRDPPARRRTGRRRRASPTTALALATEQKERGNEVYARHPARRDPRGADGASGEARRYFARRAALATSSACGRSPRTATRGSRALCPRR